MPLHGCRMHSWVRLCLCRLLLTHQQQSGALYPCLKAAPVRAGYRQYLGRERTYSFIGYPDKNSAQLWSFQLVRHCFLAGGRSSCFHGICALSIFTAVLYLHISAGSAWGLQQLDCALCPGYVCPLCGRSFGNGCNKVPRTNVRDVIDCRP